LYRKHPVAVKRRGGVDLLPWGNLGGGRDRTVKISKFGK